MPTYKNIAVYGDSFATGVRKDNPIAWYNLLGRAFGAKVTTYGQGGTSVYFSYDKFLKTHEEYDLKIFVVTHPMRYAGKVNLGGQDHFVSGLAQIDFLKTGRQRPAPPWWPTNLTSDELEKLRDVEGWVRAMPIDFINTVTELMLDHMFRLDNNVIFYPAFEESFTEQRLKAHGLDQQYCLEYFTKRQLDYLFGKNYTGPRGIEYEVKENTSAHMGPELNEAFFHSLYTKMVTGHWDFSKFHNIELKHSRDFYYNLP